MSESKFTPEFIKAQRTLLEKSKTTRAVAPLVQFRATAVENYPPALDEIERLHADDTDKSKRVAELTETLKGLTEKQRDSIAALERDVSRVGDLLRERDDMIATLRAALTAANEDAAALDKALAYAFSMVDEEHGRDEDYLLGLNEAHITHLARVGGSDATD